MMSELNLSFYLKLFNIPQIKVIVQQVVSEDRHEVHRFLKMFEQESSPEGTSKRQMELHVYGLYVKYIRQVFGEYVWKYSKCIYCH